MKFLLASLPHNLHAQNIALALHDAHWLGAYRSGAVDNYRHARSRIARSIFDNVAPSMGARLARRRIHTIPDDFVFADRTWDGLVALGALLRFNDNFRDWLWEWSEMRFDQRCARLIRQPQFDAYFGVEFGARLAAESARDLGKPVVIAFLSAHHETLREFVFTEYSRHPELMSPYVEQLLRLAPRRNERKDAEIRLADIVHTASRFTAASLVKHTGIDPRKVMIIPLGAPPPVHNHIDGDAASRIRFMYAGQVSVLKGFHYLIEAWKLLDARGRARLDVFGPCHMPSQVLERAGRGVTFHGKVAHAQLLNEYASASVLVFPTLCDGFGQVVPEALSRGVPVITTSNAGAADLIEDGRNGFVVPPRDPEALADRMRWFMGHASELRRMRSAAVETARTWTWDRFRNSLQQNVTGILGEKFDLAPLATCANPMSADGRQSHECESV